MIEVEKLNRHQKCPICRKRLCDVIDGMGNVTTEMVCPQCKQKVKVVLTANDNAKVKSMMPNGIT